MMKDDRTDKRKREVILGILKQIQSSLPKDCGVVLLTLTRTRYLAELIKSLKLEE